MLSSTVNIPTIDDRVMRENGSNTSFITICSLKYQYVALQRVYNQIKMSTH